MLAANKGNIQLSQRNASHCRIRKRTSQRLITAKALGLDFHLDESYTFEELNYFYSGRSQRIQHTELLARNQNDNRPCIH